MWQKLNGPADIVDVGRGQQQTPVIDVIYGHKHTVNMRRTRQTHRQHETDASNTPPTEAAETTG